MRSKILDQGLEDMWVYPEILHEDKRGNKIKLPSETPIQFRVTTSIDQGSDAELAGQVSVEVLRCITRSAPVGSWSRIVYQDKEWDLAYPPRQTPGLTRLTRHTEFGIRSRNATAGADGALGKN